MDSEKKKEDVLGTEKEPGSCKIMELCSGISKIKQP